VKAKRFLTLDEKHLLITLVPTKSPFSLPKFILLSPETRVILVNGKKWAVYVLQEWIAG